MEGHDLGEPEDWYPAVAARSRRCLVSTSIAKQPEREIRPAISRSPSLPPFLRFFSSTFVKLVPSPSLPLSFSCSLIFTANPRNDRHYPYREDPGCLFENRISEVSLHGEKMELTATEWKEKFPSIFSVIPCANVCHTDYTELFITRISYSLHLFHGWTLEFGVDVFTH